MKRLFYLVALILLANLAKAQSFPWAKSGVGTGLDEGFAICTDIMNNVFITGSFDSFKAPIIQKQPPTLIEGCHLKYTKHY
jgi:hypothetical protein